MNRVGQVDTEMITNQIMRVNQTERKDRNDERISSQQKADPSGLSIDDFLKIMAAEISNPSFGGGEGGGGKTDYISQLAQFTSLEQLGAIGQSLDLLSLMGQQQYAFSLIGKEVTINTGEEIEGSETGEMKKIVGIVDKVKFENGIAVVEVGGETYYLGAIEEVAMAKEDEELIDPPELPEDLEETPENIEDYLFRDSEILGTEEVW